MQERLIKSDYHFSKGRGYMSEGGWVQNVIPLYLILAVVHKYICEFPNRILKFQKLIAFLVVAKTTSPVSVIL